MVKAAVDAFEYQDEDESTTAIRVWQAMIHAFHSPTTPLQNIGQESAVGVRDLLIARAADCVVLSKVVDGNPMTSTLVAIPLEDISEVIKALKTCAIEDHHHD
jgi:hypothetical protein